MADRSEMFALTRVFLEMADSMEPCKMFWGRPLLPWQRNLGYFCIKSPISRLIWQRDRRCLGLPGVFGDGRFNGTMQNVVGPPLVAMATKFGLGAEIQSPTGLSFLSANW